MALRTESITAQHPDLPKVLALYEQAFPKAERIPFADVLGNDPVGYGPRVRAFYAEHQFVGFITTVERDDLMLVGYFAVDATLRGHGYGSSVLAQLATENLGKRIVLEIEVLDAQAANYPQRLARRHFYERNGFTLTTISYRAYGVPFTIMVHGGTIDAAEYHAFYDPLLPAGEVQPL